MPTEHAAPTPPPIDPRPRRALRLATGVALCLAASFGLALPLPFLAPMLTLFVLAGRTTPLPLKAALALPLLVMAITGASLTVIPLLQYTPICGLLVVGLCLYYCFRSTLRGGNALVGTFCVVGLTLITTAGTADFGMALTVIEALAKGLVLAVLSGAVAHALFPEPAAQTTAPAEKTSLAEAGWIALRATLVVMPTLLLALIDPASYLALIMKAVGLGQQVCSKDTRHAGRELVGSTLHGGLLALLFWSLLGILPVLWMFFLWTLLFSLLLARSLYRLRPARYSPGFYLNSLATLLLLLGQSVQDSASGKDVYTAFAVRLTLFIGVALYAWLAVVVIDYWHTRHSPLRHVPGA